MHHIMRSDPGRRLAFRITIEDLAIQLWFCDRALVLVPKPIKSESHCSIDSNNLIEKDCRSLAALIVALEFASRTALGHGPTIECVRQVDPRAAYRIQVPVEQRPLEGGALKF